jgi:hypothetical protein
MPFARAILNGSDRGFSLQVTTNPVAQDPSSSPPSALPPRVVDTAHQKAGLWLISQLWTSYGDSPAVAGSGPARGGRRPATAPLTASSRPVQTRGRASSIFSVAPTTTCSSSRAASRAPGSTPSRGAGSPARPVRGYRRRPPRTGGERGAARALRCPDADPVPRPARRPRRLPGRGRGRRRPGGVPRTAVR